MAAKRDLRILGVAGQRDPKMLNPDTQPDPRSVGLAGQSDPAYFCSVLGLFQYYWVFLGSRTQHWWLLLIVFWSWLGS